MINTLPKSLIEASYRVLANVCCTPHHAVMSLHSIERNHTDPLDFFGIVESTSDFHQWAMETEHNQGLKLPVDAFTRYGNAKDDAQMVDRVNTMPTMHRELFRNHFNAMNNSQRNAVNQLVYTGLLISISHLAPFM